MSLKKLGRYDIVKPLGKGAMGLVYEAHDPNIDRRVAIKTIRVDQLSEEMAAEYESRFRAEARAGGRLQHPNIIGVYDAGRDQNVAFMVMELVRGGDLKQQLEQGDRLGLARSFAIMRGLLAALGFAHEQGIIHRDIKPANVMLDSNGRVKLGDFGVARITHSGEATRTQGSMVGTLKYMSPEQVKGLPVDARTDLFAAGVVLYQMLTGKKPFDGPNDFAIMQAITQQEPTPPSQLDQSLPVALDAVVARALAKDRDSRYVSAREFVLALRAAVASVGAVGTVGPAVGAAVGQAVAVNLAATEPGVGPSGPRAGQAPTGRPTTDRAAPDHSVGQVSAPGSNAASQPTGSKPGSSTREPTGPGAPASAANAAATASARARTRAGEGSIALQTGGTNGPQLLPPVSADPSGIAVSPLTQELELHYWKGIQDSSDPVDFQGFLQQFPAGLYAGLAARRLRRLARSLTDGTGSQSVAGTSPSGSNLPDGAPVEAASGRSSPGAGGSFAEPSQGGSRPARITPDGRRPSPRGENEAAGGTAAATGGTAAAAGDSDEALRLAALRAAEEEALWQQEQARERQRIGVAAAEATPTGHPQGGPDVAARRAGGHRPFADSVFGAAPSPSSPSSFIDLSTTPMPLRAVDEALGPVPVDTVPVESATSAHSRVERSHLAASHPEPPAARAASTLSMPSTTPPPQAPFTPPEWPPRAEIKSRVAGAAVAGAVSLVAVAAAWWAWSSRDVSSATSARLTASAPAVAASRPGVAGAASSGLRLPERAGR